MAGTVRASQRRLVYSLSSCIRPAIRFPHGTAEKSERAHVARLLNGTSVPPLCVRHLQHSLGAPRPGPSGDVLGSTCHSGSRGWALCLPLPSGELSLPDS